MAHWGVLRAQTPIGDHMIPGRPQWLPTRTLLSPDQSGTAGGTSRSYSVKLIKRVVMVGVLMVVTTLSLLCAPTPTPLETPADLLGFVTEISPIGVGGIIGQISVESHADKIVSKFVITIDDGTLVFRQHDNNLHPAGFEALESKQWLKVWFAGPVVESFPVQGTAGQIVLVE